MKATFSDMFRLPHGWPLLAILTGLFSLPLMAAQNTLTTVSVAEGQNGSQVIKFVLKNALDVMPVSFTTSNPHRLVLDFPNTDNSMGRVQEPLNAGGVKNYQIVRSADRTRVVFNLTGPASHELRKDKNIVLAVLRMAESQGASADAPAAAPARFSESGTPREHAIRDVDFRRGKDGEGRIAILLTDPGVGIDIQQKGKTIQVDFLNSSLPAPLRRRMDVSDFATPAQSVEIFEQGKHVRMLVTPKGRWDYSAYQTGSQFIMEVRSLDESQLAKLDKLLYTGEKLTLNFQNVEIRSVLQVIADFTGLNIIASDSVKGSLTLRLKDVPWDQALDIIMRSKGLDKRASGNVIWVAPRDELAAKEKQELEAKKAIDDLEPLVTRSYSLNYIRADDAMALISGESRKGSASQAEASCEPSTKGTLKAESTTSSNTGGGDLSLRDASGKSSSKVNRVLSDRGGASNDLTTNTLVVTDTLARHENIEKVLKSVDIPTRQVMIEARIVIADDSFSRDLGARLALRGTGRIAGTRLGVSSSADNSIDLINAGNVTPETGFNVDMPVSGGQTLGFTIVNAASTVLLGLELQALEADNRGKVISNPRVVTTNLRPAAILQGTQIPYQTQTEGTSQAATTSFKDALLCLLVSPQVLNNDSIILNVEVQKDAQGADTNAGPAINVRRVKTQVRVNNGETAILGGIYEQALRNDVTKVPLFGDIPVLGHLFRNTSKSDEKSEMLIFLTPRILDDQSPFKY